MRTVQPTTVRSGTAWSNIEVESARSVCDHTTGESQRFRNPLGITPGQPELEPSAAIALKDPRTHDELVLFSRHDFDRKRGALFIIATAASRRDVVLRISLSNRLQIAVQFATAASTQSRSRDTGREDRRAAAPNTTIVGCAFHRTARCSDMTIALVDLILQRWQRELGGDFRAYRNHVHRVIHFCDAYRHGNAEEREKVIIAACFHDLGIWTNRTFDYLQPSVVLMRSYLRETGLEAWSPHIELMIAMHHRIRPHDDAVVEAFRRSDLVDLSLGLVRFALPSSCVREVKKDYPNAGFHRALVRVATSWLARHPLNPLPVVRW